MAGSTFPSQKRKKTDGFGALLNVVVSPGTLKGLCALSKVSKT